MILDKSTFWRVASLVSLAALSISSIPAAAQGPTQQLTVVERNQDQGTLRVRNSNGEDLDFKFNPRSARLYYFVPGDPMTASLTKTVAVDVVGRGSGKPTSSAFASGPMPVTSDPTGIFREVNQRFTITSIDTDKKTVTIRNSDGARTAHIENPELQQRVNRLRPGDDVEVTYIETLTIDEKPRR